MGILDTILGAVKGQVANNAVPGSTDNNLLESVIGLISDPQSGGLMGLVEKISASGLGEHVASWVGTGQNMAISGDQIQAVLGSSFVQDLASKMGINTADVASSLANLLPQVIDKLTPDGQVSEDNNLLQMGLTGLSSLLGNKSA